MKIIIKLIRESLAFAIQSIIVNKTRTILSLLGITIGIFSVISVLTIFDSMEIAIRKNIDSLGNNVLFIQKWPWAGGPDFPWWKYYQRPQPTPEEMKIIQQQSFGAEATTFLFESRRSVEYLNNNIDEISVRGVSHDFDKVFPLDLAEGRYFTTIESQGGHNVALIGSTIAENLFENTTPLNKRIKVYGNKVTVIGVIQKEGEDMFGGSSDEQVILPLNYAKNYFDIRSVETSIVVKAKEGISNEALTNELTGIMRSARKLKPKAEDTFSINETSLITQNFDSFFRTIGIIGWIIGGFSLLVGGFGIANIMFVSVKERTSQIGIQMALGAKRLFILLQFLIESVFLSLFGGFFGLFIIFILILLSRSFPFPLVLTLNNIGIGIGVSFIIGLLAGLFPSYAASRLDPVEAMRSTF